MTGSLGLGASNLARDLGGDALQSIGEANLEKMECLGQQSLVSSQVGLGVTVRRLDFFCQP